MNIGDNVRRHVVSISSDEENPMIFGPYTRRKAEELAAQFNTSIGNEAKVEGEYNFIYATAPTITNPQTLKALRAAMGLDRELAPPRD